MKQVLIVAFAAMVLSHSAGFVLADVTADATAVIDKAIAALGGAEKLAAVKAATWKTKGKIILQGQENKMSSTVTVQGLDHSRQEFEGEFNGDEVKGVNVMAGDKGWWKFGETARELDKDALENQKRTIYLQAVAATLLPLKDPGVKFEAVTEEKVGDKPAVAVKAKSPDGKEMQIFFDKESNLPVKQVAKVTDFRGNEYVQEATYSDYKDFNGIKRATKIELKRDGQKFGEQEITEFKVLEEVEPSTFAEPN
jgi:hypothetical protein